MIGSKIATARKEANLSQAQLAQQLFISPQAVGKWERGESIPDIVTMTRLAEILGVDLNYFSEHSQPGNEITTATSAPANDAERAEQEAPTETSKRELLMNFSGSDLENSDLTGVTAHKRKFNGSNLRSANFSGADLAGSSFSGSDMRGSNFDQADLTDCTFSAVDLTDASFDQAVLLRTEFSASELKGAKFTGATLTDARLTKTDLRQTTFDNCVFKGVDFHYSDLRGLNLDAQTFIDVKFDNGALNGCTFHGATLNNVSFRASFALTNRFYKGIQTISFDGATMDKLTYAALKGLGADLSKCTII